MSQVVPIVLGTVGTENVEGLASGTSWDIPGSPNYSWDCQDWDSRGASLWDFPGYPKYTTVLGTVRTGILGLAFGTCRDVPSSPSFS